MVRLYCQVTGVVLLVVGVLGIVYQGALVPGLLSVHEPGEIALHLVLGAASTFVGFTKGDYGNKALLYAKVFGPVYIVLGVLGFIVPTILSPIISLDLGCNVVHLVLGAWGSWAGYAAQTPGEAPAAA